MLRQHLIKFVRRSGECGDKAVSEADHVYVVG